MDHTSMHEPIQDEFSGCKNIVWIAPAVRFYPEAIDPAPLKDGIFLVPTPNIASLWKRMRFLLLGRSPNWDLKDYFENWNNFKGHSREFTKKELSDMLAWSDFEILLAETRNVFRNEERLFSKSPQKAVSQIFEFFSPPFPNMRDTVYIVATPKK